MGVKQSRVESQKSKVKEKPNLEVELAGVRLKNPVMTASGTFGYGEEYADFVDLNRLGAVVVKGISLKPIIGNPPPRICETPSGMLNAIGLQNVGVDVLLKEKLPYLRRFDTVIIVNIFGYTVKEYVAVAEKLDRAEGISALEINVSCPNVKRGGMIFGTDIKVLKRLIHAVKQSTHIPVITKLSPNVTNITDFARAAEDSGSNAISLINTFLGMSIDIKSRRPRLANITGGLSGPAIRPIAVRMVWEVAKAVKVPVIGMGGIMSAEDALEFIMAGATAVAVGTANFVNPRATIDIIEGIERYMLDNGINRITELIGVVNDS